MSEETFELRRVNLSPEMQYLADEIETLKGVTRAQQERIVYLEAHVNQLEADKKKGFFKRWLSR